jgi:CubicO group peptidase (beta-lactamase class C family)
MVERASGVSYRRFVETEVFARAGMDRSGFFRMDVVEPDIAEGVEPILQGDRVVGYRRNIYSYPPVGALAGGAYCTVGDLLAFRRAVHGGRLLGPEMTANLLRPHRKHGEKDGITRMIGCGLEFSIGSDGRVLKRWKEGVNPGASGLLQHYPEQDLTLAILGIGEDAVWKPAVALDKDIR